MKNILKALIVLGVLSGIESATALPLETNTAQDEASITSHQIKESSDHQYLVTTNESLDSLEARNNEGHVNPIPETQDPRIEEIVFDFDNSYDYGTCLDAILLAYEGRNSELKNAAQNNCSEQVFEVFGENLSRDVTLQLIESANYHATRELRITLYPSWGLRRRVAINFGYMYDIDRNNNDVVQYLSSNQ
ncbi:MAG: hypothetical protein QNJ60_03665 [Xenococcaceae cyanobacterium MO_188.B19]|nr:hypothetical protein [Xenococcaceae cyanobacterium MO_188.B19]